MVKKSGVRSRESRVKGEKLFLLTPDSRLQTPDLIVPDRDEDVTRKTGLIYAAVLSFVISTVTMLGLGWALDRWLGTSPWLVVAGIVVGAGVGFYQFIRLLSRIS